ncbi:hypothetical protein K438DRAFT_1972758 [Mycena galopus ATCC 62051]|nr:hypothetical protein K438DRAFT_1972758 [Mycena galopus ATCC 62051]
MHPSNVRLSRLTFFGAFGQPISIVNEGFHAGNVDRRGILAQELLCEPTDTQGSNLEDSSNSEDGSVDCLYADGTGCIYATADGSLQEGNGPCPPTLAGVVLSSPTSNSGPTPSATRSSTVTAGAAQSSAFNTSPTILTPKTPSSTSDGSTGLGQSTSEPTQPSNGGFASSGTAISSGEAAGISIAVAALLLGFIVAFVLCRRRRQRRKRDSERDPTIMTPRLDAVSPFPVIVGRRSNTVLNEDPHARLDSTREGLVDSRSDEKNAPSETSQSSTNGDGVVQQSSTYSDQEMSETNAGSSGYNGSIQSRPPRTSGHRPWRPNSRPPNSK